MGLPGSGDKYLLSQESGCNVLEIVDGSRLKARAMVDAAVKVQAHISYHISQVKDSHMFTQSTVFRSFLDLVIVLVD